jgi:signal transduction histidine kinase/ActR/RegA family two-component response regulator
MAIQESGLELDYGQTSEGDRNAMTMVDPSAVQEMLTALLSVQNGTDDISDILDQALDVISPILGQSLGCICLQSDDRLQIRTQWGLNGHVDELPCPVTASPLWQRPASSPTVIALADAPDDELARALARAGLSAVLAVPLTAHGERLGALYAGSHGGDLPPVIDETLWSSVGAALGMVVSYWRMGVQMRRQARESQTIYEIGSAFAATTDLDDLLNLIVRSAVETIEKADNCVLHLFDEETGELQPRALSFLGLVQPDAGGRSRMRIGQGVAGQALETGRVINVPDVSKDDRFIRVGIVRPFASMLAVPIKMGDQRIGTLSADSKETNAFSPDDERLLMTMATQAAAAIENARLLRNVQQSLRDLKATQAQLIQSEKLSAIGQLIAGVAHELNNPLTAVMGYTQLLQTADGIDEDAMRDLTKIYSQAQRAAKIVQNLLTFARQYKAERQFVDVNEVLNRTLELRTYQLRVENIDVVTEMDERVLGTMADPNQLQQVFLNLINNAQDAMVDYRGNGRLIVRSELHGTKIQVRFIDDGPGLPPRVRQHLFEPFFTTKEVGKGTGLGLSICFGIISQHEGEIRAESESGQGATFVVELPYVEEHAVRQAENTEVVPPRIRGKRVLVVEDEEDVAVVLQRILTQDGHRVFWAENGQMALNHLAQASVSGTEFDLIISDIKMPGLSGPALFARLHDESPELCRRMVFLTGDTMSPGTRDFLQGIDAPYLTKPFTISDLRRIIIELVDGA